MNILFINACVRNQSRTLVLARDVLSTKAGNVTEVNLQQLGLPPLDRQQLEHREGLVKQGNREDPMLEHAITFANADEIVIAAPFWDLSFPALLKVYLEHINVAGITFQYTNGVPNGLCKARRLTYVTTSGGPIFCDFGYSYVKALANNFYGIKDTLSVRATHLDVLGISADELLSKAQITTVQ